MNRAQLIELLTLERFQPLPARPAPGLAIQENIRIPVIAEDTEKAVEARRRELLDATDDPAVLVQRRGIYVVPRRAA